MWQPTTTDRFTEYLQFFHSIHRANDRHCGRNRHGVRLDQSLLVQRRLPGSHAIWPDVVVINVRILRAIVW